MRNGSPGRLTNSELRIRIIGSATSLFAEKGYHAVSIRELAASSEVTLPALYRVFEDKEDIYTSCCKECLTEFTKNFDSLFDDETDARQTIDKYTRLSLKNAYDTTSPSLLQRILFEGDPAPFGNELEIFLKSNAYVQPLLAAQKLSDKVSGSVRLSLIQALCNDIRQVKRFWELEEDAPFAGMDFDQTVNCLLSIVFPGVDWNTGTS